MLTVATLLSIPLPAKSNQLNDLYYSCYENGNTQSCGRLGTLCGQGNGRACNLVQTASGAGMNQIRYYYLQRKNGRACNFLQLVRQAGSVGNLARSCSQGNSRACSAVSIIACYASENARAGRGPRCRALD